MPLVVDPHHQLWYHGTDVYFTHWQVPPPPKPGEESSVAHSAVFFTTHVNYAEALGSGLCTARLQSEAKVLNATRPSVECELLRREVIAHPLAACARHLHDSSLWINGWNSGDAMRCTFTDAHALKMVSDEVARMQAAGMSRENAWMMAENNFSRGLVELICVSARKLGFDAIYGRESGRHPRWGRVARPWLAVLRASALLPMDWVRRPSALAQQPEDEEATL